MTIWFRFLAMCILGLGLSACQLPENHQKYEPTLSVSAQLKFQQDAQSQQFLQKGLTAYLNLSDPFMSMATRVYLIRHAKTHLDLQYYIWENDVIGRQVLLELLKAAQRGVQIRLLLDDQNGTQLDELLLQLVQHPNFKVRIFNPYQYRHFRVYDYLFRFKQINRRMHNKLLIADGSAAITGGRNISSEYFDAGKEFQFVDMDVFFAGKAVNQANKVFADFWNDALSYPIQTLTSTKQHFNLNELQEQNRLNLASQQDTHVEQQIQHAEKMIRQQLENAPIRWANAKFMADPPGKIRGLTNTSELLIHQIMQSMGQPQQQMELVSAYFVPTAQGEQYLIHQAQKGVKIRVLTNAYLANDVPLVHAYYQKYRQNLLKHGIELYEFKPNIQRQHRTWYEVMTGNVIPAKSKNHSRLHAKFFGIDNKIFIGSFNFDPRSVTLNTEVGLMLESKNLQQDMTRSLNQHLKRYAYELKLGPQGQLIWFEQDENGQLKSYVVDPHTTKFQRIMFKSLSYLPFEWMM